MKKLLAMTLALSLSALMFASCGDEGNDSGSADTNSTAAESKAEAEESKADEETEDSKAEESEAEDEGEGESDEPAEFDITKVTGYDEGATETVLEFTDEISTDWASCFADDDFIDARSFDRDKDLHVKVDFEYTESYNERFDAGITNQHDTQIVLGPCSANGWAKLSEAPDGVICDYPHAAALEEGGEWVTSGENVCTADTADLDKADQVWPDVFIKTDGFIKIGDHGVTSIEFTVPAEKVNAMIDNAFAEESWDGILFQLGGNVYVTKITLDQGNVFMQSTITESGM